MSYQNAELPKLGSEMCAAAAAMAREYEVRHGWQNFEAQVREGADQRFAARNYAFARLLKPCIVLYGGDRTSDGEAIKGVGVEAALHPFQRLDQRSLANGKANSYTKSLRS